MTPWTRRQGLCQRQKQPAPSTSKLSNGSHNVLALTTRTPSAQHLQGFFQQSHRRANAETAVKVAGATAKHCVVLHGKSTFLSGTASGNDFDHECYTRANVAYSRATDLTISACPVNMQGPLVWRRFSLRCCMARARYTPMTNKHPKPSRLEVGF